MNITRTPTTRKHLWRTGCLNTGTTVLYSNKVCVKVSLNVVDNDYVIAHSNDQCLLVDLATGALIPVHVNYEVVKIDCDLQYCIKR